MAAAEPPGRPCLQVPEPRGAGRTPSNTPALPLAPPGHTPASSPARPRLRACTAGPPAAARIIPVR